MTKRKHGENDLKTAVSKALLIESELGQPYMVTIACRLCILAEQGDTEAARLIFDIMAGNSEKTARFACKQSKNRP